jgi:hypothetical protein
MKIWLTVFCASGVWSTLSASEVNSFSGLLLHRGPHWTPLYTCIREVVSVTCRKNSSDLQNSSVAGRGGDGSESFCLCVNTKLSEYLLLFRGDICRKCKD